MITGTQTIVEQFSDAGGVVSGNKEGQGIVYPGSVFGRLPFSSK
jgi:hypothetical protein